MITRAISPSGPSQEPCKLTSLHFAEDVNAKALGILLLLLLGFLASSGERRCLDGRQRYEACQSSASLLSSCCWKGVGQMTDVS